MYSEDLLDKISEITGWIGAVSGIIVFEYFYFNNAEPVRLLFVILLIPCGLIIGGSG